MRDLLLDKSHGTRTETRRYGYRPGSGDREDWVILCTVKGALGPFERTRTITESPWHLDPRDPNREA